MDQSWFIHSISLRARPLLLGSQGESQQFFSQGQLKEECSPPPPYPSPPLQPNHPHPFITLSQPALAPDHLSHAGHLRGLVS